MASYLIWDLCISRSFFGSLSLRLNRGLRCVASPHLWDKWRFWAAHRTRGVSLAVRFRQLHLGQGLTAQRVMAVGFSAACFCSQAHPERPRTAALRKEAVVVYRMRRLIWHEIGGVTVSGACTFRPYRRPRNVTARQLDRRIPRD